MLRILSFILSQQGQFKDFQQGRDGGNLEFLLIIFLFLVQFYNQLKVVLRMAIKILIGQMCGQTGFLTPHLRIGLVPLAKAQASFRNKLQILHGETLNIEERSTLERQIKRPM